MSSRNRSFHCIQRGSGKERPSRYRARSHGSATTRTPRLDRPVTDAADEGRIAGEDAGQIEPEPVDAQIGQAVERLHDQCLRRRRRRVDGVARAGIVDVRPIVVQHVVVAVGEAAQAVQRAVLVLLGRVVEHDVEPHLDVPFVSRGHEPGQFARRVTSDDPYGPWIAPNTTGM